MCRKQKEVSQRCLTPMAQKERGVTLIALAITIVVLLILAAVTIRLVIGDEGIINKAQDASEQWEEAEQTEAEGRQSLAEQIAQKSVRYASNKSKVGYYADINGDGQITVADDGIIFADLAVGASGTGLEESYSLSAVTSGLKNYEESTATYEGAFGTQKWLTVASGSTGLDRFYVMALQNIDSNTHYWYYNAYNYSGKTLITSDGIASTESAVGRANTEAIMGVYGRATDQGGWGLKATGSTKDMFDVIAEKYNSGWFVPSKKEWAAFADATMTGNKKVRSNYSSFGLSNYCWSSSQYADNLNNAGYADFNNGTFNYFTIHRNYYVRLCATF